MSTALIIPNGTRPWTTKYRRVPLHTVHCTNQCMTEIFVKPVGHRLLYVLLISEFGIINGVVITLVSIASSSTRRRSSVERGMTVYKHDERQCWLVAEVNFAIRCLTYRTSILKLVGILNTIGTGIWCHCVLVLSTTLVSSHDELEAQTKNWNSQCDRKVYFI